MSMTEFAEAADSVEADPACAGAVDLARAAAVEVAEIPTHVGAHQGVYPIAADVVGLGAVHRFVSEHPGYVGWVWAVSLSRVAESAEVTIDEVWLEPGEGALRRSQRRRRGERNSERRSKQQRSQKMKKENSSNKPTQTKQEKIPSRRRSNAA